LAAGTYDVFSLRFTNGDRDMIFLQIVFGKAYFVVGWFGKSAVGLIVADEVNMN
jgi:hypothetical protein